MYECFSPNGTHRVVTNEYGEACMYHMIGYTVFDFSQCKAEAVNYHYI